MRLLKPALSACFCLLCVCGTPLNTISAQDNYRSDQYEQNITDVDQHMAKKKVHLFLRAMEGVEDYQLEPFTKNMYQFFYEYQRLSDLRTFQRSQKDADKRVRNREINRTNDQITKLHSITRKNLKEVLDKKQLKAYNRLIAKIAPPPRVNSNRTASSDDAWLRGGAASGGNEYHPRNLNK